MTESNNPKTEELKHILHAMGSVLIAVSGGVDSAFLLDVASEVLREKVKAATFISPVFPQHDLNRAKTLTQRLGIRHIKIKFDILSHKDFMKNDRMRCRFCKLRMIEELKKEAEKQGLEYIADGSNRDDLRDYRPGLEVGQKDIKSPLIEAGFTKEEIRKEAKAREIDIWDTPSSACLASRIAFGTPIRERDISMIGRAEEVMHRLGFREVRVRYHPPIARIEVSTHEISRLAKLPTRDTVIKKLKELGFTYITLDLSGYRSGSMNAVLS